MLGAEVVHCATTLLAAQPPCQCAPAYSSASSRRGRRSAGSARVRLLAWLRISSTCGRPGHGGDDCRLLAARMCRGDQLGEALKLLSLRTADKGGCRWQQGEAHPV